MKKRILFVDDEPNILNGLRRALHRMSQTWDMAFATGARPAIAQLESMPFDVIVCDMRMPGMDGAELLLHAREHHPKVIRFVLSGHTDRAAALRAVPVAHQFLAKPCDVDTLRNVIERVCRLQSQVGDDANRERIGRIGALPSLLRTHATLVKTLELPNPSVEIVADAAKQDIAVCAMLLQVANSAFFGLPRRVTAASDAVAAMGTGLLKDIVSSVDVLPNSPRTDPFSADSLHEHAALTARIATRLLPADGPRDEAFMASMLHDCGILVLATQFEEKHVRVLAAVKEQGRPYHVVEQELFGIDHAGIGSYLLGLWGIPDPIVDAVALHHTPRKSTERAFGTTAAVYVADHLAHECLSGGHGIAEPARSVDLEYLESLGVADHLPAWTAMAAEQASQLRSP